MKRPQRPSRSSTMPVRTIVAAAVALASAGAAQAQLRPYYVTVSETISYDSNVFRVPESEGESSDWTSITALTVGVDQPIGRQRVYASIGTSYSAYRDNDDLNGLGYNIGAGLDWEAASRLAGNVRVGAQQSQAKFDNYGSLQERTSGKNEEKVKTLDFTVSYGQVSILSLEALGNYTKVDYSTSGFASRERKSRMFGGGVRYRPGGPWSFGLTGRKTKGEYPQAATSGGESVADEYDRTDIDLTAQYVASGKSNLSARLTQTDEEHELDSNRDFDGLTGALSWRYQATGKVNFALSLSRETGSGSSTNVGPVATDPDLPPPPTQSVTYLTDSRRTDSIGLAATWQATGRITVNGNVSYSRERYDDRFVSESSTTDGGSSGNSSSFGIGATYAITRVWSAGCGLGYEKRSSDVRVNGTEYGYDATTGYCSVTLALR